MSVRHRLVRPGLVFSFLLVLLLVYRFGSAPALWWDEGWTLAAAKNYVETGHFGQLNDGLQVSQGLAGHFPVILSVAMGFRLFGVGIWQGRLPFLVYTLLAAGVLIILTHRLFGRKASLGTLFAILLLVPHPQIHPVLSGRQVLGDIPSAFFFLAGCLCLPGERTRQPLSLLAAALFWAAALATKAQMLYLGAAGLLVAVIVLAAARQYRRAVQVLLGGAGGYLGFLWFTQWFFASLPPVGETGTALTGLFEATAIVLNPEIRIRSLLLVFIAALPFILALIVEGARLSRSIFRRETGSAPDPAGVVVWAVSSAYFAWFLLLSNGGDRYLAVPVALAAPFTGCMLAEATAGFDFKSAVRRAAWIFQPRQWSGEVFSSAFVLVAVLILLPATLFVGWLSLQDSNKPLLDTADYLNTSTPPDARIETYSSELFIFLERPYHFPPDQVHVDLLKRFVYRTDAEIFYDPLVFAPDYLVVGPNERAWGLYTGAIESGAFVPEADFGRYEVYRRTELP